MKAVGPEGLAGSNPVLSAYTSIKFTSKTPNIFVYYFSGINIMNKKTILLLPLFILISSCSDNINVSNIVNQDKVNISSNKKNEEIKFLDTKNIPNDIIELTHQEAQKASDKSSKARGIDYFNIHKNPLALEFNFNNEKAYLINYLGTSKNTQDLNIEFRSFYTTSEIGYNFNYSGPITLSNTKNIEKGNTKLNKKSSIRFELITGMPPEYIVNSFEEYIEREFKPSIKMLYRRDIEISNDVFPYAVYADNEVKGFLFLNSRNVLVLGERKYADMQLVTFIDINNNIKSKLALIGFNPKTKISTPPKYEMKNIDDLSIVEFGDL